MNRGKHISYSLLKTFWMISLCILFSNCDNDMYVQPSVSEDYLDEYVQHNQTLLELERARSYYEKIDTMPPLPPLFVGDSIPVGSYTASPKLKKAPSWQCYTCSQNDSLLVVEVDLSDCIEQNYVLKESLEEYQKHKQSKYRRSYIRYVYTRHLRTGKEQGFFMTIVPALDYIRKYSTRIEHNTYLHRDKYLSGYVLFHNLDGSFSNGWTYKDGKIIGRLVSRAHAWVLHLDMSKRLHLEKVPVSDTEESEQDR